MKESQIKIDKLQTILETSKFLNSSRDSNQILHSLLEKSLQLIDGADAGAILLYNKDTNLLEVTCFSGFNNNIMQLRLTPDESISGRVFTTQKTIFTNNLKEVDELIGTMNDENILQMKKSLDRDINELRGSICCPLIYKEECIGVIVIDSFDKETPISQSDILILEAISVQATIAIINARQYEKELRNNEVLEEYNQIISEERNRYKYSTNIHSKFTEMVLKRFTIKDILHEISLLLDRDVFILDVFFNINDCCLRQYTDHETLLEIKRHFEKHLRNMKKSEYFHSEKNLHFYFSPIIVDLDTLGWLCIVSDDPSFSELDKITIEKGTTIIALELLKMNELSDMEQSLKGDFLDNLILNQNKEYLMQCAKNFKFHFEKNHQIIIFEFSEDKHLLSHEKYRKKLKKYIKYYYNILNEKTNREFPNAIVLIKGHTIVVILEINEEHNKKRIEHFLDDVLSINQVHGLSRYRKIKIKAGISQVISGIENFKTAYYNTQQIIKMSNDTQNDKPYLFYDDLEIKKILLNNSKEELDCFLSKTLGPLLSYEKQVKDEFLNTLKVYIQSNGNWTYTKNHLHIHGNTLTYRLNRIMDLLKMDLSDYYQRFNIQIAFEILDITPDYFK